MNKIKRQWFKNGTTFAIYPQYAFECVFLTVKHYFAANFVVKIEWLIASSLQNQKGHALYYYMLKEGKRNRLALGEGEEVVELVDKCGR